MDAPAPSRPTWYAKVRYHHGNLRSSALARGREIVAARGPHGLTLAGLARDLGVTATALVYYFKDLNGLRAALAESVLEQAAQEAGAGPVRAIGPATPGPGREASMRKAGDGWIAFAAANPELYRLASRDGWRHDAMVPSLASPRRTLEAAFIAQTRRLGQPLGEPDLACLLAFSLHGLALARIDGVPEAAVARAWERVMAAPPG